MPATPTTMCIGGPTGRAATSRCGPLPAPIPLGIGSGSEISGAIIDKNARIGRNVVIRPFPRGADLDGENWVVRDGIVVIPKRAVLPDGTYIGPGRESD